MTWPEWTTQNISYWGSPKGSAYKVVKSGKFWKGYRYASKWYEICKSENKTEAQKKCEDYDDRLV